MDTPVPDIQVPTLMDTPVPDIQVPTLAPSSYVPTSNVPTSPVQKNWIDKAKEFADWVLSYIPPEPKRIVNEKLEALKTTSKGYIQ